MSADSSAAQPAAASATANNTTAGTTSTSAAVTGAQQGLSAERVKEMRSAIHQHLTQTNTYDQLREIIATHAAEHVDFNPNNPDDVMTLVKERGVVQEILGRMNAPQVSQKVGTGSKRGLTGLKPGQRYLHLRLLGGRAFLDNVDADPKVLKQQQMVLSVHFDRQRLRSSPVDCHCDPQFDDDFLLELNTEGMEELIDLNATLNLAVSKEDLHFGKSRIIGENSVDWRKVLKAGYLSMSIELAGDNPGVPAGIVELQLELVPGGRRYAEEEILNTMQHQRSQVTALDREFLIYARRWWQEFHSIRPQHADRKVKVFAANSTGRMVPVTHFVTPIQPDRCIDTPLDAARFVSLFQMDHSGSEAVTQEVLAGGSTRSNSEAWNSQFAFLIQRRGESSNHATLLCSLLLGFGLDAYCVIGTDRANKTRMWVATRTKTGAYNYTIQFWEPTTAQRFEQTGEHPFVTVGSCFNHVQLYANTSDSDNAVTLNFEFEDENNWKSMNPIKLKIVPKPKPAPLLWIPLDTRTMECDVEQNLMIAIKTYREALSLPTKFDARLPFLLSQALVGYEAQRNSGGKVGAGPDMHMFNSCVKGTIGEGRTFKGFPLNTTHTNADKMMASFNANATAKEILELSADDAHIAIRVRITPFPEGVFSLWVMLAGWYRSLP